MDEILIFIATYCNGIFLKYGFRFVDSVVSPSFGNAGVVLENENLKLGFVRDKGQLFVDFYSKFDKKKNNPYSFELIRELVSGEKDKGKYTGVLEGNNGRFFQENLEIIFAPFEKDVIDQTLEKLNLLRKKRAKRIFG